MSINTSDFSKQSVNYSLGSESRATEEFAALRQANAKVVQSSADTNKANKDDSNTGSSHSFGKVEAYDIEAMNEKMSQLNVQLTFEMRENQNIVKVLDQTTGDVVRQIPTEDFLKMSERIDAIMSELSEVKGSLVNSEV
ncbi:flagellar protein FlaG [Marinomonas ushuaiensis DSM 15871]|uniref:Flagellar protein FlaG n=1 Tax=Marinomonas ushuaiensis DSM 15871 TaxID=1122207 RepID=X7E056_9GAMM|nr:flagellar protein FlaG [Marinomonas ushuaiensis]ETX09419.1 flagellar protein FlaG [Marinomonas ushuaiensis DSM 15871]